MPDRDDVDKLVIGSFCSIGSGAAFIMAGNQGHRAEWASTFPSTSCTKSLPSPAP